jgi:hypothetical protein
MDYLNRNQIPYLKTNPIVLTFIATANAGAKQIGFFDWTLQTSRITANPRVDLNPQNLYAIHYYSFTADIEQADYQSSMDILTTPPGGIAGVPRFNLYVQSEGSGPILNQSIPIPQYCEDNDYEKWRVYSKENSDGANQLSIAFQGIKNTNQFEGAFEARIAQLPALAGKQNISLIFSISMSEIRDAGFISQYKQAQKSALELAGLRK